jgi:hypothetical protein
MKETTIIWYPTTGRVLPDDETTVLCGWTDDHTVDLGYMDGDQWRACASNCAFETAPDFWAHTPAVPQAKPGRQVVGPTNGEA